VSYRCCDASWVVHKTSIVVAITIAVILGGLIAITYYGAR
jgi:hypothetical protein